VSWCDPFCSLTKYEYEFIFMFMAWLRVDTRLLAIGLVFWAGGTVVLRMAGAAILHPDNIAATVGLFLVSFLITAGLARTLCRWLHVPPEQWPSAAASLVLPTLLLDPFTTAFFSSVFPNLPPSAAGVFGGWMLCCAAGGLVGGLARPHATAG
jgi:hypothetical protein